MKDRNRNVGLVIVACVCIFVLVCSVLLSGIVPVFAQSSIVRRQTVQVGFQNQWEEITVTYTFGLDGGLNVEDSRGSQFYFAPPKFQPSFAPVVSLSENESHVTQHFWVNGSTVNPEGKIEAKTLDLRVSYDFTVFQSGTKITLQGSTNDTDSEVEYEFENPKGANMANTTTSYRIGFITFDWSDLEGATTFEFAVNKLKVKFASTFNLDPTLVTTVTTASPVSFPFQRKLLYDCNLWWYFYADGGNMLYRTSSDGAQWSSAVQTGVPATGGYFFSVWHHSPNMSFVSFATTYYLYYRRGTLNSDGTISWNTALQTIASTSSELGVQSYPFVAVDSAGYPYVTYITPATNLSVTKSQFNNGTWSTASGYPLQLNSNSITSVRGLVLPLSDSQRMYAVYYGFAGAVGQPLVGKLYNGATWLSEESVSTSPIDRLDFNALALGDDVYLAFVKTDDQTTVFLKRTYGSGWSSEHVFEGYRQNPTLSIIDSTKLCLFMAECSSPTTPTAITYREYTIATDIWGVEGTINYRPLVYNLNSLYTATANHELAVAFKYSQLNMLFFAKITTQPPEIPETFIPSGLSIEEEKPPAEEGAEEPSVLPKLGIWGLLGAVGIIAVGGLMTVSSGTPKRRKGKSSYKPSQPQRSYYHKSRKMPSYRRMNS